MHKKLFLISFVRKFPRNLNFSTQSQRLTKEELIQKGKYEKFYNVKYTEEEFVRKFPKTILTNFNYDLEINAIKPYDDFKYFSLS